MYVLGIIAQNPYKIFIEDNLLKYAHIEIKKLHNYKKVVIVSDSTVTKFYLNSLVKNLESAGFTVYYFIFESGEKSKNLNTVFNIYNFLNEKRITKSDLLIALGGGVVGDITGFVASTYLRGIEYVNIPTSLLSQVDSCLGGKTGVNLIGGKNLVGSFYSPRAVFIDPTVLSTLSNQNFLDGMAEIIKYGIIKNKNLFSFLENTLTIKKDINNLIYECLKVKKELVEKDEFDKNDRLLLNFGHTLGHAIEKFYNFEKYSHGQAVAIGILYMTKRCEKLGVASKGVYKRVENILKKYDLLFDEVLDFNALVEISLSDKKFRADIINLVLLRDIGDCFIKKLNINQFEEFMLGEDDT